jgi:uncharacterized protein (DUF934 family)
MPLLKHKTLVSDDPWVFQEEFSDVTETSIVVPFTQLLQQVTIAQPQARLGVRLSSEESLDDLIPRLNQVSLVEIYFEALRDGRGFSFARLLRREGFQGEIRASGEVSRDRLDYLYRCGFDSVLLQAPIDAEQAQTAYQEISVHYQADARNDQPIYRQIL